MALMLDEVMQRHLLGPQVPDISRHTRAGRRRSRFGQCEAATCAPQKPSPKDTSRAQTETPSTSAEHEFQPFYPTSSELVRALSLWDTDRDGKIWVSDFDNILCLSYGLPTQSEGPTTDEEGGKAEVDKISLWEKLKADCMTFDGLIDIHKATRTILGKKEIGEEIARLVREGRVKMMTSRSSRGGMMSLAEYMRAFLKLDKDRNGVICARDLKDATSVITGGKMSSEMCKEVIRQVDRDHNGVVDLKEFWELLKLL